RSARRTGWQLVLRREVQRRESRRGVAAGEQGRRLRLAILLLRVSRAPPGACARVRRRWNQSRPLREQEGAGRRLSGALGAERSALLYGLAIPGALQERRVYRIPWILEPRARTTGG